MKKLFLILALFAFAFNATAQTTPIVTYKISTTGYSNGLTIPSPFYFSVNTLGAEIGATGFSLYSYSVNTTDSAGTVKVVNDSISQLKIYPISVAEVDTMTLDQMIESRVKQNLIDVYGSENVSKVE